MKDTDLVAQVGASLDVPGLAPNADGACAIRLADGLELDIQVLAACEELRLTLPLGQPDPAHLTHVLTEALLANSLVASSSPHHLAWDSRTQRLVLCQSLRFDQVSPSLLKQDLDEFIAACRTLRLQLQQDGLLQP